MNSPFHKISIEQILFFTEILSDSSLFSEEHIRGRYLRISQNYEEIVNFSKSLGLIKVKNGYIKPDRTYQNFIDNQFNSNPSKDLITNFIRDLIFEVDGYLGSAIDDFLSKFRADEVSFHFNPTTSENVYYSDIRNFFIELEIINYNSREKAYFLSANYIANYVKRQEKQATSLNDFLEILNNRKILGMEAEQFVLEFEKKRLDDSPQLASKIEHVAVSNVSAGYDILSFEHDLDNDNSAIPRFIEVKAVPLPSYRFYWTKNELRTAEKYADRYFLYLVTLSDKSNVRKEVGKIIQDPWNSIYHQGDPWKKDIEVLSLTLIRENQPSNEES